MFFLFTPPLQIFFYLHHRSRCFIYTTAPDFFLFTPPLKTFFPIYTTVPNGFPIYTTAPDFFPFHTTAPDVFICTTTPDIFYLHHRSRCFIYTTTPDVFLFIPPLQMFSICT